MKQFGVVLGLVVAVVALVWLAMRIPSAPHAADPADTANVAPPPSVASAEERASHTEVAPPPSSPSRVEDDSIAATKPVDFRLDPRNVVASGRFVFAEGQRATQIVVHVERRAVDPLGREQFHPEAFHIEASGDRFFVTGTAPPGRYRLTFPGRNHLPIEPIEFTPGDRDIVVKVDRGVARQVRLRLPDGVHPGARGLLGAIGDDPRLVVELTDIADDYGALQWPSVPVDVRRWELRIRGIERPLASFPDVAAQTEVVDLRALVDVVTLRKKVQGDALVYLLPRPVEGTWRGIPFRDAVLQLLVPKGPTHFVVVVRDQPPIELRDARGEVVVEPTPWPEVEIVIAADRPLPPDHGWIALLRPGPGSPEWRSPRASHHDGDGDRVRLPIGAEPCQLTLWLGSQHGGPMIRVPCEPSLVPPGVATFVVRVTAEAMQRARAEAAK